MSSIITYSQIVEATSLFNSLKGTLSNMRCNCWGVYRLEEYETDCGFKGTHYVYVSNYGTEQECLDYVERLINLGNRSESQYNYVVVPVTRDGVGIIYMGDRDISKYFGLYNGPCKVMLEDGENIRRWFQANKLSGGAHDEEVCAEVNIIDKKPGDWIEINYNENSLVPIWSK